MKTQTLSCKPPTMSLLRLCCLAFFLTIAGQASAQREPMVLYNFIDIPVAVPSATKERVKTAITRAALFISWNIVEEPDGALLASWSRVGDYGMKVRITYDEAKYSLVYVDSFGLRVSSAKDLMNFPDDMMARALAVQAARFKDWAETPYMVKTENYIHLTYEDDVRGLLASIRRHLLAPAI